MGRELLEFERAWLEVVRLGQHPQHLRLAAKLQLLAAQDMLLARRVLVAQLGAFALFALLTQCLLAAQESPEFALAARQIAMLLFEWAGLLAARVQVAQAQPA